MKTTIQKSEQINSALALITGLSTFPSGGNLENLSDHLERLRMAVDASKGIVDGARLEEPNGLVVGGRDRISGKTWFSDGESGEDKRGLVDE